VLPVGRLTGAANDGADEPWGVAFSSTDTVLSNVSVTATSGLPSPLRSATATE
jgi:hypothetical protein